MNPRVAQIVPSLIREIAALKRPTSIDLGLGEPSLMPNMEHFEHAMTFVRRNGVHYTQNAGDVGLRERIAAHYAYPHMPDADNVCVTTGSQEAMFAVLMALLDPVCDDLLIVEPAFPSYVKMARLNGIACSIVAMREEDDFAFDAERIAAALGPRTRAIVLCSPCNPTARVISRSEVDALVAALERRGGEPVWIIHDEVYREQTFIADAGYFASVYPRTIVTNSLSKSNALTGLRIGWILSPREIANEMVKCHAWLTSCADAFAQQVAVHVFSTPGAVREHAAWYEEQAGLVRDVLAHSGLRFIAPEGSFYACVRLPDGIDSVAAARVLASEYDVIAIPGVTFGASFASWLRLSWVAPIDAVRTGVERIASFAQRA